MPQKTGTITATGTGSGVIMALGTNGPDVAANVGVGGTFTSAVVQVDTQLRGGTLYYPAAMFDRKSGAKSNGTSSTTDSTNQSWLVDVRGCQNLRVSCASGTPTSLGVEIASGQKSDFDGPVQFNTLTFTSNSAFGAGISFTGATTVNVISIPDNLADSLSIAEGATSYITFVTTDGSEGISVKKDMTLASGVDLIFSGTTGQSLIKFPDNLASALVMGEAANAYITFCTTDSGEKITFAKSCFFSNGIIANTGGSTAITTTRAVTRADAGGNFTVAQSSAYTITVAQPLGAGERYVFQCVSPGANDVSIVATSCTFEGTITIDAATIPATGSTLKFATGAAILGDNIELISTSTTKFMVRAIGSGAGGITIT